MYINSSILICKVIIINKIGSNASSASIQEILFGGGGKRLSGNVTISSGSKYLHCPPPPEWQKGEPTTAG